MSSADPLRVTDSLTWGSEHATIYRPDRLPGVDPVRLARRPRTLRVLLENILRHFDPAVTDPASLVALANGGAVPEGTEFAYYPERVLLQDFTGVPVLVDLSTLRSATARRGLDPTRVNPVVPVDLIIDHSVQVDSFGSSRSIGINLDREYERNGERYRFLRWAKGAYTNVHVVPPGNGICHQVNLEYLSTVVQSRGGNGSRVVFPDTLIGTDSHTTMVNGVSVLSWGVGGIEAEAVLLGEPYFLARPEIVGVELTGALPEGATATDLVLTVTRRLREKGVVDKFVEFLGPGVRHLSVPDRATVSNMCPEYGATAALFPIDEATLAYLRGTGRSPELIARVEAYARAQGLFGSPAPGSIDYDDVLSIDVSAIVPTVAGPRNPEESVALGEAPNSFRNALQSYRKGRPAPVAVPGGARDTPGRRWVRGHCRDHQLHEHVQSYRDGGRRSHRETGGRARSQGSPARQDVAGPGVEGRDGLPRTRRTSSLPRPARVRGRGIWMHDLHWQFRAAPGAGRSAGARPGPLRGGGAEREP